MTQAKAKGANVNKVLLIRAPLTISNEYKAFWLLSPSPALFFRFRFMPRQIKTAAKCKNV